MKTTEFRSMLKKNSLVFFTYKKLTDELYRSNYLDYLLQNQIKSRETIRKELDLMKEYWKCDPMNYYRYRLYEKDISSEELLDYVPPFYFYNYYVPSIYSEAKIREAESKILMNKYLASKNVSVPREVCTVIKGNIFSNGDMLDYDGFIRKLQQSGSDRFFMKPDRGRGGRGIYRIEKIGRELFINNEFLSGEYFNEITGRQDFLVQEGLVQRNDIMQVYPHSVNTLRVITQNFNGKPVISVVMFRMGRKGAFVDNSSSGGISTNVNLSTGVIGRYAIDLDNNMKFDRHPDSGFRYEGFTIAGWDEIKEQILDFAGKTPEFPDIGWDIAITGEGIKVIEMNLNYGIDLQCIVGGLRRMLNIVPFESPVRCNKG